MIERLTICGYRGFERFELKPLGRINLLVGRNSAGKTSVLEAVRLLCTGLLEPSEVRGVIWDAARRRGEVVADHARLRHLLHRGAAPTARLSADAGTLTLAAVAESRWQLDISHAKGSWGDTRDTQERWLLADDDALPRPRAQDLRDEDGWTVHPIVGPELSPPSVLAETFGRVVLTPEEDRLTAALRLLEPRLLRLAATSGDRPQLVVKLDGVPERVPLGNLGGGIRRLAQLWLSFALAGGNPLLIDEIDAGLHYSVMVDMWRRVRRLATERDVQVFATTHSWDCVAALGSMCLDDGVPADEITLHRIEAEADAAVAYSAERIALAVEQDIEVR